MADIVVTAASVSVVTTGTNPTVVQNGGVSLEALTAGKSVYLGTGGYGLCVATVSSKAVPAGIALNSAPGVGQPISVATGGDVNLGAGVTICTAYIPSATAGGIAPNTDATTGFYPGLLGIGISTNIIRLGLLSSTATSKP